MGQNRPDDSGESLEDIFKDVKEYIGPLNDTYSSQSSSATTRAAQQPTTFPTEMNCSQVFDQLLKCYSLGGQIRHYYRYGEISYCLDKRDKLKFCLGTKMMSEEDRKEKVRRWHMEHLAEQQQKRQTSEIVWKSREKPFRMPFREDSEKYLRDSNN